MTVILTPEIEEAVAEVARRQGTTPEEIILGTLREKFAPQKPNEWPIEPRDEWERRLLSIGSPAGVSLTNEQVSSESFYD